MRENGKAARANLHERMKATTRLKMKAEKWATEFGICSKFSTIRLVSESCQLPDSITFYLKT